MAAADPQQNILRFTGPAMAQPEYPTSATEAVQTKSSPHQADDTRAMPASQPAADVSTSELPHTAPLDAKDTSSDVHVLLTLGPLVGDAKELPAKTGKRTLPTDQPIEVVEPSSENSKTSKDSAPEIPEAILEPDEGAKNDADEEESEKKEISQDAAEGSVVTDKPDEAQDDNSPTKGAEDCEENATAAEQLPHDDASDNKVEVPEPELSWEEKRQKLPKVAEVKWYNNFERFKNRYSEDEGLEIIEVLRANPNTAREVQEERARRIGRKKRKTNESEKSKEDGEGTWMQRVRIQSPPILYLLSRISGHGSEWSVDSPRTFFRPFRAFYYFQPRMKEYLHVLRLKLAEQERKEATTGEANDGGIKDEEGTAKPESKAVEDIDSDVESSDDDEADKDEIEEEPLLAGVAVEMDEVLKSDASGEHNKTTSTDSIGDIATAVKHLRCYVKFVDQHIMPMYKQFAGMSRRRIRFHDLWMCFNSGEILYQPIATETKSQNSVGVRSTSHQSAWRLVSMEYEHYVEGPADTLEKGRKGNLELNLEIRAYYIDYNGSSYGPVHKTFKIPSYEGEKEINSLNIYPMRYAQNADAMRKQLEDQGRRFQSIVKDKHLFYEGWTLTYPPVGEVEAEHKNPEHVEGDVIIDFLEGYKKDPSLKPVFETTTKYEDKDWPSTDDGLPIIYWSDPMRIKTLGRIKEKAQINEWFGGYLEKKHSSSNKFIKQWDNGKVTELEGDDVLLLPRRMMAYALRERKFVMVDLHSLRPVITQENVFRDLKIQDSHKRMVKSLVKAHFLKQDFHKNHPAGDLNQDLIRGKGTGLVILLHGVPGVGKTATAEAVAQANNKPLFVITCGDLGFTPSEVEGALKDIFRLAHLWECILLLDEADIFLSKRDIGDLKRNALVSVFLRVLEYYSGILFLTTNRVGILDEAFKSRIHVSLYYPRLSLEQTLAIFELNIRKLQAIEDARQKQQDESTVGLDVDVDGIMDWAEWYFNRGDLEDSQRWNGRQIRNAFQIASSLADFDMEKSSLEHWDELESPTAQKKSDESGGPASAAPRRILNWRQFDVVAKAIEDFDQYLIEATGTDEDNARTLGIRADNYDPRQTPNNRPKYYPPRSRAGPPQYLRPTRRNSNLHDNPQSPSSSHRSPGRSERGGYRGPPPGRSREERYPAQRPNYRPPPLPPQGQQRGSDSPARGGTGRPVSARGTPQAQRGRRQEYTTTPARRPIPRPRQEDSGYSGWSATPRSVEHGNYPPEDQEEGHEGAYREEYTEGGYEEGGYDDEEYVEGEKYY
ncbi:hypothetical protein M011DRAFT_469020 [Sporormia fimetaria CBS 119925]|uniref:AAA+ ATPase domain-containing protein n=1 Tax=Sporormia fimetaria CBS 119925 TaxID=1340428 RepID=A0A6A6V663_9PLEO|nr:hypothetical protein M011DRAFT_469020 [Sporormia fimetaria CBS 119925]